MKRISLWVAMITTTFYTYSQTLNYNEIGLLISKDNNFGTARFNAMSGAFGALGGDISSLSINPAGMAIARNSEVSVTLGVKAISALTNYYGNSNISENSFFNIEQGGSVFVFDSYYTNSNWNRFALSFNYRLKADFDNFYTGTGNSQRLFFTEHIGDSDSPKNSFDGAIGQDFSNETKGQSSVFNLGFSAVHNKKLYVGASLNFHNFNYTQTAYLLEENDDVNGNILIAENYNDTFLDGGGFSVGFGFIYKINKNIRFGLAYETPTWYNEMIEEFTDEIIMNQIRALNIAADRELTINNPFVFRFKTPSKMTVSGAYIFNKQGLISLDYTYRDYTNTKYRENDAFLLEANQEFSTNFRNTQQLNIGTEWRFDKISIRAGYHYEENPNLVLGENTNKDNFRGFSAGVGYSFKNTYIDIAYREMNNTTFYSIYNTGDISVTNNTSHISGSLRFNL